MKVHSTEQIYDGKVINLRVDEIDDNHGGTRKTEVVEHTGGVAVIAQPAPGEIVLVKQYRHPTGERLWEVPAGLRDRDESAIETGRRELIEETGYRAERVTELWSMYSTPGFCNERIVFVLAEGLTPGEAEPESDEQFELKVWRVEDAFALIERDEMRDAKTQLALNWAIRRLRGGANS
jgi:ADP-ribose pyrophosphatase